MLEERFDLLRVENMADGFSAEAVRDVEYIFSTWGMPKTDSAFLEAFPKLKAIFYAAGSIKFFVTPEFWERDIPVFSGWAANGVPVAEWSFAQIILSLKQTWTAVRQIQESKRMDHQAYFTNRVPGTYGSTVALLSLGMIGRYVAERLKTLDVNVIAYDPFISPEDAAELGLRLVSLEEAFAEADVISCHTPWLKETEGMLGRELFASMKPNASFINTARGAVVNEPEMIAVLEQRPDITAVLDVTYPEPPVEGSPLYTLPNVILTPHIAGSIQNECRRMARLMIEDYDRFAAGKPTRWQVTEARAATLA